MRRILLAFVFLAACKRGDETAPAGKTLIPVTVDDHGFTPNSVEVTKGEAVALAFTRTSDDTCAKQVVFSEIDVTKDLPLNKTVYVVVPTEEARTFTFACGMQMYKSTVVVK